MLYFAFVEGQWFVILLYEFMLSFCDIFHDVNFNMNHTYDSDN